MRSRRVFALARLLSATPSLAPSLARRTRIGYAAAVGTQTLLPFDHVFVPAPQRTAPRVWLEEVRIYAAPDQELRRVPLRPGLNVIWAPDASPEEQVGARIGH